MIQIYVGQKATENQWRVMVLRIVLHTTLLYQASNTRKTNLYLYHANANQQYLYLFKQYLVLVQKKEQWGDFPVQSAFVNMQ